MLYWLFTDGRNVLVGLLCPSVCFGVLAPVAAAWFAGIGIQRRADGSPSQVRGSLSTGKRWVFILSSTAVLTVYLWLVGPTAVQPTTTRQKPLSALLSLLIGAPNSVNAPRLLLFGAVGLMPIVGVNLALWQGLRNGGWLRERVDRLRKPGMVHGEMGSAHFCTPREFRRYRRPDPNGITFLGAFWGDRNVRVDYGLGRFSLGGEDAARGVLALGAPGSGKTAAIILPVIADRMGAGHSLIVADPQGELTDHVKRFAQVTGHLVVIHDPTSAAGPRFNLAEGITSVSDARSIAGVLIPEAGGENRFWSDSATALLAACLIRFNTLGEIYGALNDLNALARTLTTKADDAALLANSFVASVGSDGKVASNVVATLATALTGWASTEVRANTSASDFNARLIVNQPAVVVLTCPDHTRDVYAPYLGATLNKLMRDLNTIGRENGGPLPAPVGIIIDEFPTLGRLDSLVRDVNLVRKRRISVLVAAQTKGQFHLIYGEEATKALFTGLATQIVYGGCDYDTAEFYSRAAGTTTADANPDPKRANLRQRPLLTSDEIMSTNEGNCFIFSRFVEPNYARQIILKAQLTRFYERVDWKTHLEAAEHREPMILERGTPAVPTPQLEGAVLPVMPASQIAPPVNAFSPFNEQQDVMNERIERAKAQAQGKLERDLAVTAGLKPMNLADLKVILDTES